MIELSKKVNSIEISGIRKFYNKVAEVPGAISLTLGEPDFKIPAEVKEAMKSAIDENKTTYTPNAGIMPLRQEIAAYLNGDGRNYTASEICVTVGGSEGISDIFQTVLNEGDKVLIPDIAYVAYESCVKLAGGTVINYPLLSDLSVDMKALREIIEREKPKVIVVSYPSNPTGMILDREQCEELHDILKNTETLIISDEMYASIAFENFYTISTYEDLKERMILVGGFSKMFSMTGIRVGFTAAPVEILESIIKVHQYNVSCAPSIGQYGALAGLRKSMYHVEYIKKDLKERMEYVYGRLVSMGMDVVKPKGAFYIFPSIKKFNMSSEEFCERLLREAGVAVVPGSAFGKGGEGYVRISYCYAREQLEKALDAMEKWVNNSTF